MDLSKLSVNKIRTELWTCHILSEQRCLRKACEWTEDLLFALPEEGEEKLMAKLDTDLNNPTGDFNPQYEHSKMCFELQEYDRAAYIIRDQLDNDKSRFLHYFARYKGAEKKRFDLMNEVNLTINKKAMLKFIEIRDSLERCMDRKKPDGWLLYVYGLILHKFKLIECAIDVLVKSINLTPNNWSAWHMLSLLIDRTEQFHTLDLPNHMFKVFFYYIKRLNFDMVNEDPWVLVSRKDTKNFFDKYFKNSLFLKTLTAKSLGYQSLKYDEALDLFAQIRIDDPYRIDDMEIYSNLLYVRRQHAIDFESSKRMSKELSKLAYDIEKIDPFTSEANSCIANSFSAREQHTKAIMYFTRALRINPDLSNSWTLLGHEYLELKDTDKAKRAYQLAIAINKRDCRAWLGLGNTHENDQSSPSKSSAPDYTKCLFYYSQVGKYRPKDPIMYKAMGSIYEKMKLIEQAILCYKRAGPDGLLRIAELHKSKNSRQEAAVTSVYLSVDDSN